jgi:hypothetical protein
MSIADLNPLSCALFLLQRSLASVSQRVARDAGIRRFAVPLDAGRTLGGRRLLGDNKTVRGFMVMVPATGIAFALLASLLSALPGLTGLWPLSSAAMRSGQLGSGRVHGW